MVRWTLAATAFAVVAGALASEGHTVVPGPTLQRLDTEPSFLIVRPSLPVRALALHSRPGGPVVAKLKPRTGFGGRLALGVVRVDGGWLAVSTAELPNGRLGWVPRKKVRIASTRVSLVADLSKRTLALRVGNRTVRRIRVAIGAPDSPTPIGRFAVTDKFAGARYGSYLGCCVLVLSGRQPNLPSGWQGGDLLGIHGTSRLSAVGSPSSAGCLRARDRDMRILMRRVPLGTPVFIRP